jgi:hypothetical protein
MFFGGFSQLGKKKKEGAKMGPSLQITKKIM